MLHSIFTRLLVPTFLAVASTGTLVIAAPVPPPATAQNNGGLVAPRPIALDVPFAATELRKALELPRSEAQFGFNADYSPVVGTIWRWQFDPTPDARAEVERLTATLKNNDQDATTWLHIGYFRGQQGDSTGAHEAYQKAETLFRAQMAQHPQDAVPLQGLGATLISLEQNEEAEKVLRAAVKLAPNDPHGLILLAGFITSQISTPLFADLARAAGLSNGIAGDAPLDANGNVDKNALPAVMARVLSLAAPDKLQVAQVRLQEAKTLNDLAVALAPHDPVIYLERAGGAFSRASVQQALAMVSAAWEQQNNPTTPEARREAMTGLLFGALQSVGTSLLNPDSQADLERAAQFLAPTEAVRLRTMAVLIGAFRTSLEKDATPEQLAQSRLNLLSNVSEIEKIAQTTQPPSARLWALLALGRMANAEFRGEDDDDNDEQIIALRKGAEEAARRALALDENQSIAWDVLMIIVSKGDGRLPEMQQLATRRLALAPTASNQFILARNLALQGKDQEALRQIETGLKAAPDDWLLRLLRATLLLRQPDETSLKAAIPLVAELGRAPQASGSDAELFNILNGVTLARLHRFYEAELALASGPTTGEGAAAVAYSALMADIEELARALATAKRHEDVLSLARVMARLPQFAKRQDLTKALGITPAELAVLGAQ